MNERIRELMPKPWTFPYPDRELYTKEQFEEFAEMVWKEAYESGYAAGCSDTFEGGV